MRKPLALLVVLCSSLLVPPTRADVAPLTPEARRMMELREWLENAARARFGNEAVERARDWRRAYGSIIVGEQRPGAKPRFLMKDEHGWYEVEPGRTERLAKPVNHELNRLMDGEALWNEAPYDEARACKGSARLFILRHAGREQFGREPCGATGLAGRAAQVAATGRIPSGGNPEAVAFAKESAPPGVPQRQHDLTRQIFHRLSDMAASWERKLLAGFVDPYADDVIVERPDGVLRGRTAVVEWVRAQQDWSSPDMSSRLTLHQASMPPVQGDLFYGTHELRWEQDGLPVRQTFSTLWRNNGGLWQIIHERVSPVKPVTERAPL